MKKLVKERNEIRDKVNRAVRLITEPVVQTLSPYGGNVLYEDANGGLNLTNDGVTIARHISSDDPIENAVIEVIKSGALNTNRGAGDGTTTTTLFTSVLINEGQKKLDEGFNPIQLKKGFEKMGEMILDNLKAIKIASDEDLFNVARISASGDEEIAKNVVDVVTTAGEDGIVLIEDSPKDKTEVKKEKGFIVEGGLFGPEYAQNNGFTASFDDCHVFVTDKRIYYAEEAETILRTAIGAGITQLVIVARDFIGKSVNVFAANQQQNEHIKLMLIKDPHASETNTYSLIDLAAYLDGPLVREKDGNIIDNITEASFCQASRVYANPQRAVITAAKEPSAELTERIEALKKEKEEDPDNEEVERRLASLTSGMVTVKVSGDTPIEARELMFKYEDAINATRSAMKHGYLPGGGLGILGAYRPNYFDPDYDTVARKLCESSVRQIAKNCGQYEEYILAGSQPTLGLGFNAYNLTFESLLDAGVIDAYKVTELAVKNAVSIANAILTANWFIIKDKEEENGK